MRDITTNPEWEKAYQYEIPVLARVLSDGTEVCVLLCYSVWLFVVKVKFRLFVFIISTMFI